MIPANLLNLISALIDKTNAKLAVWGKTSREDEFKLVFDNGAVTTDVFTDNRNDYVDFAIYNNLGDKIDSFVLSEDDMNYELLKELHSVAKRQFYKVDETILGLFEEIKSSKSIGKRTIDNGNDLPF